MSTAKLLLCVLVLTIACQSQQTSDKPATKSGCLQSLNGQFILLGGDGRQTVLKGDHDTMFGYIGKQVQVTGTLTEPTKKDPKPAEMHVSKVKKIAEGCM